MILKILRELWRLRRSDFIPKLPRGYSERYEKMGRDEARVLARMGARSPRGAHYAMKKAGAESLDEFVGRLKHHKAVPPVRRRWASMLERIFGASQNPHRRDIIRSLRPNRDRSKTQSRVDRMMKGFK